MCFRYVGTYLGYVKHALQMYSNNVQALSVVVLCTVVLRAQRYVFTRF